MPRQPIGAPSVVYWVDGISFRFRSTLYRRHLHLIRPENGTVDALRNAPISFYLPIYIRWQL